MVTIPLYNSAYSSIKSTNHDGSRIKSCIKAESSDQEPISAIKTFDRRHRSKYRAYSGDYPLWLEASGEVLVKIMSLKV